MGLPINKHSSIIKGLEDENLIPSVAIDYLINQFYQLIPEEGSDAITTAPDKDINTTDYLGWGTEAYFQHFTQPGLSIITSPIHPVPNTSPEMLQVDSI